jgi:hypothetical protein
MTIKNPSNPPSSPPGAYVKPYAWGFQAAEPVASYSLIKNKRFSTTCKICCCAWIIIAFLLLVIIGTTIGVLVYVFFPKQPTIDPVINSMTFTTSGLSVSVQADANIAVDNPNYVDISTKNITLEAFFYCASCPKNNTGIDVGTVTISQPMDFPSKKKTTYNHVAISFHSTAVNLQDITYFLADCSATRRKVTIQLAGTITVFLLNLNIPIDVPVTKFIEVSCCQGKGC